MAEHTPSTAIGGKSYTAVAINTAAKAGEWIKSRLGDFNKLELKTSTQDIVTEIDKGCETMIRNLLRIQFPTHAFLGEEGVEPGAIASIKALQNFQNEEFLWIADPIDGTVNFVHGFPFFSVSLALAYRGEVIVGVIYDPSRDEIFVAEKGKGAYLRGKKTAVSLDAAMANSLLATGFPSDYGPNYTANMRQIHQVAPKIRNLRSSGSAALHLAYVACGRLSGFWEMGLNSWDIAAGALIVQESGGRVTDIEGVPYHLGVRNILATNGHIHDEVIVQLREQ